jgi:hypothetical protein
MLVVRPSGQPQFADGFMSPTDFAIRRAMDDGQPEKYVYSFLDSSPGLHESRRNAFSGMNAVFLLKNGKIMTTDIDRRLPWPSGAAFSERQPTRSAHAFVPLQRLASGKGIASCRQEAVGSIRLSSRQASLPAAVQ